MHADNNLNVTFFQNATFLKRLIFYKCNILVKVFQIMIKKIFLPQHVKMWELSNKLAEV